MTEAKKISIGLNKKGRVAYNRAKESDSAYIVVGNNICRMSSDGSKEVVSTLSSSTRVKAKQKKYVL